MSTTHSGHVPAGGDQPAAQGPSDDHALDVERGSDVPITTQIFWQIGYQIDSGRLLPGARLPAVRELGATLRVNPNTIRAVYRRLAEAGYVTSRHGAGTHVAQRLPRRRGEDTLSGIVAETLRRAAGAGFTPDEVAAATFAAATERKRPGPLVRVLFAECTKADAAYDAARRAGVRRPGRNGRRRSSRTSPIGSSASTMTSVPRPPSTPTRSRRSSATGCRSWRCSRGQGCSS